MSPHRRATVAPPQRPQPAMLVLGYEELARASTAALERLAAWLGVAPAGPWVLELAQRRALIVAIMGAEERLAGMAHAMRCRVDATRGTGR